MGFLYVFIVYGFNYGYGMFTIQVSVISLCYSL